MEKLGTKSGSDFSFLIGGAIEKLLVKAGPCRVSNFSFLIEGGGGGGVVGEEKDLEKLGPGSGSNFSFLTGGCGGEERDRLEAFSTKMVGFGS